MADAARISNQQAKKVSEDANVVKEISTGLKLMATSVDEVSILSNDMESASKKGQLVVRSALEKMQMVQEKSHETVTIVQQLGDHSNEIDNVITTIKNIAEETNLFALNASIEAARAGTPATARERRFKFADRFTNPRRNQRSAPFQQSFDN